MLRRALIHALVGPLVANVLLLAVTFVATVLTRPDMLDQHVAQATRLLPKLLTVGHCVLFLGWALLAVMGMFVADTRQPRSALGAVRLSLGGAMVGGPGFLAVLVCGVLGVPLWIGICAGALATCRLAARALDVDRIGAATTSRALPAPPPESRAVFGRRGLT